MKKHIALFSTTLLFASFLGGARAFADDNHNTPDPATAETNVTGRLDLSADGGYNPNPPSKELNKKTNIGNVYFGIAYAPKEFNIGSDVKLADTDEEQLIVMEGQSDDEAKKESFHVAVKDKTRSTNRGWTLKAKLSNAIEDEKLGITIKTKTKADAVMRNMNTGGEEDFESTDMKEQVKKDNDGNEVTNTANLEITTVDTDVMQAQSGKFVNGAYDLELPQVELHIPNASKVKAQQLSTSVTWTLTDAPA
ncbi:WxL domain-containing protein [Enterococcus gallinarum]|uniref:WxL domain-containing protein n=1 Tax=Enterococcus gallinarum TaxID=1353 RepID=UPI001D175AAA|nr:WxL domain-containing protein [Enterococcus gallinarum]MCC4045670.1 WxL domain-containing protein [Enterococcus gallinarum]